MWKALHTGQTGVKWKRQQPLGFYIADFVCFERSLILELDGSQHAEKAERAYDAIRTEYLEGRDFRVLRFWNSEVRDNLEGVLEAIVSALEKS